MNKHAAEGTVNSSVNATKGQARMIIALLSVIVVLIVAGGVWFFWSGEASGSEDGPVAEAEEISVPEEIEVDDGIPPVDSLHLLETAEVDSVNPAPMPEPIEAFGDYVQNRTWSGTIRVFEGGESVPVAGEDGGAFPVSMNGCGSMMYLVTFRSVDEEVLLNAQLLNAVNEVSAEVAMADGWMFSTNCQTPQFAFASSAGTSVLSDVTYEITEYRQSSVAAPEEQAAALPEAEPYVVECLFGTPGPALWSDGSTRFAEECVNTPEAQESLSAERICGGLYGWQEVTKEEYERLCAPAQYPG